MRVRGLLKKISVGFALVVLWSGGLQAAVPPASGFCPTTYSGTNFSTFTCRSSGNYGDRFLTDPKPGATDPGEAILTSVDFETSSYTCSILLGTASKEKQTISRKSICNDKIDAKLAGRSWKDFTSIDGSLASGLSTFYGRFKDGSNVPETNLALAIKQSASYSDFETYITNYTNNTYQNQLLITGAITAVDSVANYKQSLASVLVGVFTGDPDYFATGFVDVKGDVSLKSGIKLNGAAYTSGMLDELKKQLASIGALPNSSLASVKGHNPRAEKTAWESAAVSSWIGNSATNQLSLFNTHALGFLLGLNIDMKKIYNKIIMMFFLMGG